jgi:hypothetical protein
MPATVEIGAVLQRGADTRPLPPEVFVPVGRPPRRPRRQYRIHIRELGDVEIARRRGLGMYILTADAATQHHYPMHFPPVLMLDPRLTGLVDTKLRTVAFQSTDALQNPPFEAIVTMMLRVDEIAARVMLLRNPGFDAQALTRFVIRENLERQATLLRFQEFAPGIPIVGQPLTKAAVREQDRKNPG